MIYAFVLILTPLLWFAISCVLLMSMWDYQDFKDHFWNIKSEN
jgi:hypothetical protein